jgi:hypothetical protein
VSPSVNRRFPVPPRADEVLFGRRRTVGAESVEPLVPARIERPPMDAVAGESVNVVAAIPSGRVLAVHSHLDYVSPIEFELKARMNQFAA